MTKRRTERGEFRAIRRVLLDGPDFQALSAPARFCLLALKIAAGPCGLELEYEAALEHRLSAQTGLTTPVIHTALGELSTAGWLRRERNVFWIVGHLGYEPSLSPHDVKHRRGVQAYVAGMPRLGIVRQFVEEHAEWFPEDEFPPLQGRPFEGPSKGLERAKEDTETETETETETDVARQGLATASATGRLLASVSNRDTWQAEINAMLEGMPGHVHATAAEIEEAASEFLAERQPGAPPAKLRQFKRFVDVVKQQGREAPRGTSRPAEALGEAQHATARILALATENIVPGHGSRRVIRNADVERLGPSLFAAFRAVGGAPRFLETPPERIGLLHRDLATALTEARRLSPEDAAHG